MDTIIETEKLLAAMEVAESGILTGKNVYSDTQWVKAILPKEYEVKEVPNKNAIRCTSYKGILLAPYKNNDDNLISDHEDEEHWEYIKAAIKKHFGKRFLEIDHTVCFAHKDFTIYLGKNMQPAPVAQ